MLRILQNSKLIQPLISTKHAFQKRTLASISNDLENAYDVVIIGGGVAGVTLACSLGKNKYFFLFSFFTSIFKII